MHSTLFLCTADRTNLAFAALQLNKTLGFSEQVYGLGSSIFFISYAGLQIPSNVGRPSPVFPPRSICTQQQHKATPHPNQRPAAPLGKVAWRVAPPSRAERYLLSPTIEGPLSGANLTRVNSKTLNPKFGGNRETRSHQTARCTFTPPPLLRFIPVVQLMLVKLGGPRWLSIIIVSWGVVATAFAGMRNVFHFYLLRLLLGATESGTFPVSLCRHFTLGAPFSLHSKCNQLPQEG